MSITSSSRDASPQEPVEAPDARRVAATDRPHLNDLPVEQLDPLAGVENPGLADAVKIVHHEATLRKCGTH